MLLTTTSTSKEATEKRYNYIIYSGCMFYHFFSSDKKRAYKRIIKKLGFEFENREPEKNGETVCRWLKGTITNCLFTKKDQLPKGAKAIKALSNGSIVKCYYLRQNDELLFFRPNPNYKEIYKPLSLKKHIRHTLKYGVM